MTISSPNVAVYTENAVLTPTALNSLEAWASTALPSAKKMYLQDLAGSVQAADVATAGFDTVIVGLFHVHDDGSIYYNDFPVDSDTSAYICEGIQALKTTPKSTVKTVLLSFGGGNWWGHPASVSDTDYPAMKKNWPAFKAQLIALLESCNADGVDWDYEPVTTQFDNNFIIQITNEMAAHGLVTAAPYNDMANWLAVIKGTITPTGNNFAWWNLQTYAPADYVSWLTALQNASTGLTESQVGSFLLPGYSPNCSNLNDQVATIQALKASYPSLNGAFIWNYGLINCCAPTMAELIAITFEAPVPSSI
jgi:hypothetical protein